MNTTLNAYKGAVYQQATSAYSLTDQNCYEYNTGCYSIYGFEYKAGYEADGWSYLFCFASCLILDLLGGYITWINDGKKAWRVGAAGLAADPLTEISARPVPKEPMYVIINLGMSENFGEVDIADMNL